MGRAKSPVFVSPILGKPQNISEKPFPQNGKGKIFLKSRFHKMGGVKSF
jgi:hypothetical protein